MMKTWRDVKSEIRSINETEKNIIDLKAQIVSKLIDERIKLQLSQRDLAEKTGIHQSAIARMEQKGAFPKIEMLSTLAYSLGLELKLVHIKKTR